MINSRGSKAADKGTSDSSLEKMLDVLGVFTVEKPFLSVDELAEALNYPKATLYRYIRYLSSAGLVSSFVPGVYMLGPKIVELDRQARLSDPLISAGHEFLTVLSQRFSGTALLCEYYGDRVLCIDQHQVDSGVRTSYERGRPMPMFRGATSKVILAHLSDYQQKVIMLSHTEEVSRAGLGDDWNAFKKYLKNIRRQGYCVAVGEVDKGMAGIAAPIMVRKRVAGSLSVVVDVSNPNLRETDVVGQELQNKCTEIAFRIERHLCWPPNSVVLNGCGP